MIQSFLLFLIQLYTLVLIARAVMTWIPNLDWRNPIVRFIYDLTEPVLRPVRQLLPPQGGMDFSPIIVFIGLSLLSRVVIVVF
jgi:YggT family protein